MKLQNSVGQTARAGSVLIYFVFAMVILGVIAEVSALVFQNVKLSHRRQDMQAAQQFAEGGASLATAEFATAYTNQNANLVTNLLNNAAGHYAKNNSLSLSSNALTVVERTISSP